MKLLSRVAGCPFTLTLLAACAPTTVSGRQSYGGPNIARPDRILVHDFAATPGGVPTGAAIAGQRVLAGSGQTDSQGDKKQGRLAGIASLAATGNLAPS